MLVINYPTLPIYLGKQNSLSIIKFKQQQNNNKNNELQLITGKQNPLPVITKKQQSNNNNNGNNEVQIKNKENPLSVITKKNFSYGENLINKPSTSHLFPKFIVYNVEPNCNNNNNTNLAAEWSGFRITLTATQLWQLNRTKKTKETLAPFIPLGIGTILTRRTILLRQRFNGNDTSRVLTRSPYFSNPLFEKLPNWQFFNHPTTNKIINPSNSQQYLKTPTRHSLIIRINDDEALSTASKTTIIDLEENIEDYQSSLISETLINTDVDDDDNESGILTRYSSVSTIPLILTESEIELTAKTTTKIDKKNENGDLTLIQSSLNGSPSSSASSSSSSSSNYLMTKKLDRRRLSRGTRNDATSHALKLKYFQGKFSNKNLMNKAKYNMY